jgi:hypothetical protein
MNPRHPIYIVSKGRAETGLTWRALNRLGVPYRVIVEKDEVEGYSAVIPRGALLVLPQRYLDDYDTFDGLGDSKPKGPGAARNFAWEHSIGEGYSRHWVLDDNFDDFHRLNRNMKLPVRTGATFAASEDFVERYENIAIAGMNYYSFCKIDDAVPPFVLNTRIYSCLLIDNAIPYRWRGRYNEDTDLSLRVLKDGLCTLQFNAFLCGKVTTQRIKGGNTEAFYENEGTLPKSQMLADMHPDVAKVVWRFNRHHHHVDYRPFKNNRLIKKSGILHGCGINNYGMEIAEIGQQKDHPFPYPEVG